MTILIIRHGIGRGLAALTMSMCINVSHGAFELVEKATPTEGEITPQDEITAVGDEGAGAMDKPLMRSPQTVFELTPGETPPRTRSPTTQDIYRVEGYLRERHVYGEVALLPDGRVEGVLYLNGNNTVAIQGEQRPKGVVEAQDASGNIVQLQLVEPLTQPDGQPNRERD